MEAVVPSKADIKPSSLCKYISTFVGTYQLHLHGSTNTILTTETAPKETDATRIGMNKGWGVVSMTGDLQVAHYAVFL